MIYYQGATKKDSQTMKHSFGFMAPSTYLKMRTWIAKPPTVTTLGKRACSQCFLSDLNSFRDSTQKIDDCT